MIWSLQKKFRWADDVDLSAALPAAAWWSWALLACGIAAVTSYALDRESAIEGLATAEAMLHQATNMHREIELRMALARRQNMHASETGQNEPEERGRKTEAASVQSTAKWLKQLSYPWKDVLEGVEESSEQVALLGLRLDSRTDELLLDAAVKDDQMAIRWVNALTASRASFSQAYLQTREPISNPVGELVTHVQVVVSIAHTGGKP